MFFFEVLIRISRRGGGFTNLIHNNKFNFIDFHLPRGGVAYTGVPHHLGSDL